MLALLTAQNLKVAVLFDSEPKAEATAKSLVSDKLIRAEGVVHIGDALEPAPAAGADVEDLLGAEFLDLVTEAYQRELAGRRPAWNNAIPRVARRAEDGLSKLGITFNKTRPARLFLRKMGENPAAVMNSAMQERFERLFQSLNRAVTKVAQGDRPPFR